MMSNGSTLYISGYSTSQGKGEGSSNKGETHFGFEVMMIKKKEKYFIFIHLFFHSNA
jgi:hypothetical protein